jgi:dimethylaniline monooxygenase (N-oxide forming)
MMSACGFAFMVCLPLYLLQAFVPLKFLVAAGGVLLLSEAYRQLTKPSCDPSDQSPPAVSKKICIIGAGSSGLCVAKEMLAEGHIPVVFDRASTIGGLWQRGSSDASTRTALVLEDTFTSSSALNTAYSDFPIQPEFGGFETYCISQQGYMKYLAAYAQTFGLEKYVHFKTTVLSVRRKDLGPEPKYASIDENYALRKGGVTSGKWIVTTMQGSKQEDHEFDLVAVCSGQANIPRIPSILGQEHFKGNIRHSSEIKKPAQIKATYLNKRVICVGGGESASDIARSVASASARCDLSIRNAVLVLARNTLGAHPDYTEHRTMLSCPPWMRWIVYKTFVLVCFPCNVFYSKVWHNETKRNPSCLLQWKLLFTRRYLYETLVFKRSLCASIQTTKTENYLYILNNDSSKVVPGIQHIGKDGRVAFSDSSVGEYDEISLCTGYSGNQFPFLPPGFDDGVTHKRSDRYLGMIHPQLSGMAFIGFARGNVGSLVLAFEMQARWFALLASNKRDLPSTKCMNESIARDKTKKDTYEYSRASWMYANFLARYHVKCEPDVFSFFLEHPLACLKAYCGAPAGYMYRIRGLHANPKAALEGYSLSSSAILHLPPTWFLQHPLWHMTRLACEYFWSRIPIIGHVFRPALDNYY